MAYCKSSFPFVVTSIIAQISNWAAGIAFYLLGRSRVNPTLCTRSSYDSDSLRRVHVASANSVSCLSKEGFSHPSLLTTSFGAAAAEDVSLWSRTMLLGCPSCRTTLTSAGVWMISSGGGTGEAWLCSHWGCASELASVRFPPTMSSYLGREREVAQ